MPVKSSLPHSSWMERNPLRQWRKRNGYSMLMVGPMLGVSMLAIQLWENGDNRPNTENMEKLKALLDEPRLPTLWNEWFRGRPKPEIPHTFTVETSDDLTFDD